MKQNSVFIRWIIPIIDILWDKSTAVITNDESFTRHVSYTDTQIIQTLLPKLYTYYGFIINSCELFILYLISYHSKLITVRVFFFFDRKNVFFLDILSRFMVLLEINVIERFKCLAGSVLMLLDISIRKCGNVLICSFFFSLL